MNKKLLVYGTLSIVAIVAMLIGGRRLMLQKRLAEKPEPSQSVVPSTSPVGPDVSKLSLDDKKRLKEGLQQMFKKMGLKEAPPIQKFLQDEVASGDKGRVLRAFSDAVYSRNWPMSDVIPALKAFLDDPSPYVRYNAAKALFTVGDQSGQSTLLALVQATDPIYGIGQDVRIQAARTLMRFREAAAVVPIIDLYEKDLDGALLTALSDLGVQAPEEKQFRFVKDPHTIVEYAKTGDTWFVPQITSVFNNSSKPELKVAAAWALATLANDQSAVDYLAQQGRFILQNPQILDGTESGLAEYTAGTNAIKYLGAIQAPQAKQILEAALDSADPMVVQTAIVNLIYNQGGSDKAVQVIANQLADSTHAKLPWDFTLNVAAQLSDNSQIQAAGQIFSKTDVTGNWQLYTVERKNWPIYNWIDDYVVKLNKSEPPSQNQ